MSDFTAQQSDVQLLKCNTCKAAFTSIEKVKEHYKTDWHIFNSKRRSNNLIPLRKDEFKALDLKPKITAITTTTTNQSIITKTDEIKDNCNAIDEDIEELNQPPPLLGPNVSIFDDKEFETTEDCVNYMATKFGFFIPDIEYLSDLDGLLSYLGEKVKLGGYCLYCQKMFQPGRPVQNHMVSKSHCKIAYENGIDGEEFEDFYDFSASYEDVDDLELDENDEIVEKGLETNSLGELILPSGKVVGHRDFRLYYKQYYKPEESNPAVLAQQREELLRLGFKFNGIINNNKIDINNVNSLSDSEVMTMLVKYHKEIRKGMVIEQRAQRRQEMIAQRREFRSNVDKLRSAENTTAKIRDYHKTIM